MSKITAKDLAPYIGLPCAIYDGGDPIYHYIEGVDIHLNKVIAERVNYEPHQVKPILKRLEDISIEDTVHISCEIMGYDDEPDKHESWNQNDKNQIHEFGFFQFEKHDSIHVPAIISYLITKGYNLHLLPHGTYIEIDQ